MISKRKISFLLACVLIMSTLFQSLSFNSAFAEETIYYSQDFGSAEGTVPTGWTIPSDSKYLKFNNSKNAPSGAMESVSGVALNAIASGSGNRSAYANIDSDALVPDGTQYVAIDFDFYMQGGVNTCNILTIGNNQANSYTDLSNTFFALGNGDGVGARNTLRYYDYNTDSWVSIEDANEKWLHVQLFIDFLNKKMAFELKNIAGETIGTYGPFSFSSKFMNSDPSLSRINMSAFRTNGGAITLNTWIDNFNISSMNTEYVHLLSYNGLLPKGILETDYLLIENNSEIVCKPNIELPIDDISNEQEFVRVINADVMLTELPLEGYKTIFSFNNNANGNLLIDPKGQFIYQNGATEYYKIFMKDKKIQANSWYNIKCYVFLTTPEDIAYCTYIITGNFGTGTETIKTAIAARNSDNFKKLNLTFGSDILLKNISLDAKKRPNVIYKFDSSKAALLVNENNIIPETTYEATTPQLVRLGTAYGYDVNNIYWNDKNITSDICYDALNGGYKYILPLQDEDVIIKIEVGEFKDDSVTFTQQDEPYSLDPTQSWDVRKYASETRTLQIKDAKMAYRLYKPANYVENSNIKYPLVISLRAKGEGNTGFDNVPYTAGHVEDILTSGSNATNFPCFVLSPQCYNDLWVSNELNNIGMVLKITDLLIEEFDAIDSNRIYIGGLSDGAYATWYALAMRPNFFAAAYIMSGTALDTSLAEKYINTPIWTFYALDDSDAGVPRTNKAISETIESLGGDIITTEYETGGHTISWKEGLESPIFQWMFSKEKGKKNDDENINKLIQDYNNSLNPELFINYTFNKDMDNTNCTKSETILGNIVTDAMAKTTGADIAVINGSDLGEGISAGEVTEEDILNALPVKLTASVVELKGSDIMNLLTRALTAYPIEDSRFLQVSGLIINFDSTKKPSQRIISVTVNGEPLNIDKTYKVAITSHLLANNLNNTYDESLKIIENNYQLISQMFVSYLNEYNYNYLNVSTSRINELTN